MVLQRRVVDYEAQAAIELEGIAVNEPDVPGYATELIDGDVGRNQPVRIRVAPLWSELLADLDSGMRKARVAARFHAGIAAAFVQAAVRARAVTGATQVAMSGGCLHNRRLARLLHEDLQAEGFEVYQHLRVSPGDGGLSYGQAVVAAARAGTSAAKEQCDGESER